MELSVHGFVVCLLVSGIVMSFQEAYSQGMIRRWIPLGPAIAIGAELIFLSKSSHTPALVGVVVATVLIWLLLRREIDNM